MIRTTHDGLTDCILASCEGSTLLVPYNHDIDPHENHRLAAIELAENLGRNRWFYAGKCYANTWEWVPV